MIAINMTTDMSALQAEIDRLQSQKTVVAKLIELLTNDASTFRTMLHDGDRHQLNALEDEITKLRSEAAQGMVSHEHEMTDMEQKLKVRRKKNYLFLYDIIDPCDQPLTHSFFLFNTFFAGCNWKERRA